MLNIRQKHYIKTNPIKRLKYNVHTIGSNHSIYINQYTVKDSGITDVQGKICTLNCV